MEFDDIKCAAVRDLTALSVAATAARSVEADAKPFVITPEGYELHDVEAHLQAPTRKRGTVNVRDADSFIAIVNSEGASGTRLFRAVHPRPQFVAVINDHAESGPGWGDYRIVYDCPLSPEWVTWQQKNKATMSQADFAQFIEDNLPDIVSPPGSKMPDGARMLEVSRTLQAKKKVAFASGIRLSNGETQFAYEEKVDGTAGAKGQFMVPEAFVIGVPVFEGGPSYAVTARLRYRIADGGALAMWFDLERPHKIVEDAVAELNKAIEAATARTTLNGTPAGSR